MTQAFIGIGSNIAPEQNIREALARLSRFVRLTSISTFYREPAIDRPNDPPFYNGVVAIETDLPPAELKSGVLRPIEAAIGRRRSADKYDPRAIDLDLLLYDHLIVSTGELTLPDPDILSRAFVALPLYEIAPQLVLPDCRLPIRQVAAQFAAENIEPLREYTESLRDEFCNRGL